MVSDFHTNTMYYFVMKNIDALLTLKEFSFGGKGMLPNKLKKVVSAPSIGDILNMQNTSERLKQMQSKQAGRQPRKFKIARIVYKNNAIISSEGGSTAQT